MCGVLMLLPTCEVRALVDVGQGVIVREAQLLVQVVAVPCLPAEEDNIIINFPNWRASPRLAQCRLLSGNCQFLLRN